VSSRDPYTAVICDCSSSKSMRLRPYSRTVSDTLPNPEAPTSYPQRPFTPPPGALDLLLVRHGASATFVPGAPFDLVDGQGDPELAPEGRNQAELVAARLATEHVDAIYVTNLRRTVQTAEPLAARLGLEPAVEPDLREIMLGDWEGGEFRRRVAEQDPIVQRMVAEQRWGLIPGAEQDEDFAARIRAAISRLAASHPGQRVVAFTHGGVIGQILCAATEARPFAFSSAENCSISQVVVVGEQWLVRRFNDTAHLATGLATVSEPPT
jgi:probable phosphoglycerate mutase